MNKLRLAAAEYAKILAQRQKEAKEAKELKRRRFVLQNSYLSTAPKWQDIFVIMIVLFQVCLPSRVQALCVQPVDSYPGSTC